jgi:hypothetical protein
MRLKNYWIRGFELHRIQLLMHCVGASNEKWYVKVLKVAAESA